MTTRKPILVADGLGFPWLDTDVRISNLVRIGSNGRLKGSQSVEFCKSNLLHTVDQDIERFSMCMEHFSDRRGAHGNRDIWDKSDSTTRIVLFLLLVAMGGQEKGPSPRNSVEDVLFRRKLVVAYPSLEP